MATYVGSEGWLITITNTSFGNYGIRNPKYGNKNTLAMSEARLEPFKYHSFEKDEEPKKRTSGEVDTLWYVLHICAQCATHASPYLPWVPRFLQNVELYPECLSCVSFCEIFAHMWVAYVLCIICSGLQQRYCRTDPVQRCLELGSDPL